MSSTSTPVSGPGQKQWIELFYSKPSMQTCYLLEKLPSGGFAKPGPENQLVDASHIRANFRVLRREAAPLEFIMSDGSGRIRDDNHGDHYHIDGASGRYVVENGVRRVGDADAAECFQTTMRPTDRFVHLRFTADLWEDCFVSFQKPGADWTPAPGEKMTRVAPAAKAEGGHHFEIIIEAGRLAFAFNDGNGVWDANNGSNYVTFTPGKYTIMDGHAQYESPTDRDLEENPSGKAVIAPTVKPVAKPVAKSPVPVNTPASVLPVKAQ